MIIQEGLDKLSEYIAHFDLVPAYTLAMGMCFSPFSHSFIYLIDSAWTLYETSMAWATDASEGFRSEATSRSSGMCFLFTYVF